MNHACIVSTQRAQPADYLRALAVAAGDPAQVGATVGDVARHPDGDIAALIPYPDGRRVEATVLDCSGFRIADRTDAGRGFS